MDTNGSAREIVSFNEYNDYILIWRISWITKSYINVASSYLTVLHNVNINKGRYAVKLIIDDMI